MTTPNPVAPGFDFTEVETLLEIAQQTYSGIPPTPGAPPVPDPPSAWELDEELTPSKATLLDNFWQVWRNRDAENQVAIAVRGTVNTLPSIFEDLFLPLIKARSSLSLSDCDLPFSFDLNLARDEGDSAVVAGVHAGFTLGLLLMLFTTDRPLWLTLLELGDDAEVYITGHSQGASVALLLTSFVRHSSHFSSKTYKTYVYAPAKPGNDHYAYDLDQIAGVPGWAFSVASTQDWVPQVPLTLQWLNTLNTPNPIRPFSGDVADAALASLATSVTAAEEPVEAAQAEARSRFGALVDRVVGDLEGEVWKVTAADLGHPEARGALGAGCLESIFGQLKGLVLPSLDFAKAAPLVPAFATPGANPVDPEDGFWQHHLGNYLKYLRQQYGHG